jgi:hypothetical protein
MPIGFVYAAMSAERLGQTLPHPCRNAALWHHSKLAAAWELWSEIGHSAMSAQCPFARKAGSPAGASGEARLGRKADDRNCNNCHSEGAIHFGVSFWFEAVITNSMPRSGFELCEGHHGWTI